MNNFFYIVAGIAGGWLFSRNMFGFRKNPEDDELLKVCAWCKRIWLDNKWQHQKIPESVTQTHGICKQCAAKMGYDENNDQ